MVRSLQNITDTQATRSFNHLNHLLWGETHSTKAAACVTLVGPLYGSPILAKIIYFWSKGLLDGFVGAIGLLPLENDQIIC